MSFAFSKWPPAISEEHCRELVLLATVYALSHGLLYLPVNDNPPPAPTTAIHAPLALFPSPFPRHLFVNVKKLQRVYNVLYARITMDEEFLDSIMGEQGVGRVDDFTGQLWKSWKRIRDDGIAQSLHLGIFRSDYLLHAPIHGNGPLSLKQVEFNTISSSFGALSERTSGLHNYLLAATGYYGSSPYLTSSNLPENNTTSTIAEGMKAGHQAYGAKEAYILFVVQDGERNVFDQRWLEYELLERHSIRVIRQSLDELASSASLSLDRSLFITSPIHPSPLEIAVVYYRAGYTPRDYPTPTHYATRELLDRSRAINCPSIALQLAGGKKIQQVITNPGVLESFLLDEAKKYGPETFTLEDVEGIRETWMDMWGLDEPDGVKRALEHAKTLVLKPQREGGGNNVYKSSIPDFLSTLPEEERQAWIAMALIEPPSETGNYLVRAGGANEGAHKAEVVSELGIFGWALFGEKKQKVEEKEGGWLVRTKGRESDEGGVAVGFSVLDSVLLVD